MPRCNINSNVGTFTELIYACLRATLASGALSEEERFEQLLGIITRFKKKSRSSTTLTWVLLHHDVLDLGKITRSAREKFKTPPTHFGLRHNYPAFLVILRSLHL